MGEAEKQGSQYATGKRNSRQDGNRTEMQNSTAIVKGMGNGKGKSMGKYTLERDAISLAVGVQVQKEMYEGDLDMDSELEQVYLQPELSPDISISSDDDTHTTEVSDSGFDSEHDSDVDMCM
jgi:hypothetical protein